MTDITTDPWTVIVAFDPKAAVFVCHSPDVPGLVTEREYDHGQLIEWHTRSLAADLLGLDPFKVKPPTLRFVSLEAFNADD